MADIFSESIGVASTAFSSVGTAFVSALPTIFVALLLIILGYIIGWIIKKVIVRFLQSTKIDAWMSDQNLVSAIGNKKISQVAGSIAKWYVFFVFFKQAVELVNLITLREAIGFWIGYALLAIAAIVVIIAGLIIGRYVRNAIGMTKHSLRASAGLIVELAIVYVAVVMGIRLIGLPTQLLEAAFMIAFAGVVIAISLAIGISFGFALKDEAKIIVKEMKKSKK